MGAIFLLLVAGLFLRVAITELTIGTNDVSFWSLWARLIEEHGIAGAYARNPYLNHPPFSLAILQVLNQLSHVTAIALGDLLRHVQTLADLVTASAIYGVARTTGVVSPAKASLAFFLSPVAILISSFHGNTDPLMVALIACAVLLKVQQRHAAAGAMLAFACGVKIVPFLLLPLFLFPGRDRAALRTLGTFTATSLILLSPSILFGGPRVIMNIFFYRGFSGGWGIPGILSALMELAPGERETFQSLISLYFNRGNIIVLGSLGLLMLYFWLTSRHGVPEDRTADLPRYVTATLLLLLFVAPGFGVQYLLWPLPFLWFFAGRGGTVLLTVLYSAQLVLSYTLWSGTWAWWYADAMAHPMRLELTLSAIPVWIATGVVLVWGLRQLHRDSSSPDTESVA